MHLHFDHGLSKEVRWKIFYSWHSQQLYPQPMLVGTTLTGLRGKALELRVESSLRRRQHLMGKGVRLWGFGTKAIHLQLDFLQSSVNILKNQSTHPSQTESERPGDTLLMP